AHDDGKWYGFAFRDQVIQDELETAGGGPAGLVFSVAVLEVEHLIDLVGLLFVFCRGVDSAALPLSGHRGEKVFPADTAVRNIFDLVEILVRYRQFHVIIRSAVSVTDWKKRRQHFHII